MLSYNYKCSLCDKTYDISPEIMLCQVCSEKQIPGQPLMGILEVELNGTLNSKNALDFLPVENHFFPSIPVGNTPMWCPKILSDKLGLKKLYLNENF